MGKKDVRGRGAARYEGRSLKREILNVVDNGDKPSRVEEHTVCRVMGRLVLGSIWTP